MNRKTLTALALFGVAALSCSDSAVVPAPCPADGRQVTVFFADEGGEEQHASGRFVEWNEHWVSIERPDGLVIHLSSAMVHAFHENKD